MKLSLHFALNHVDPRAYGGWDGELRGCHNDAEGWKRLAVERQFDESETYLDKEATCRNFREALIGASLDAERGDIILITYSGHGSQLANPAEPDGKDETLCFFDGELRDDELRALLAAFQPGVVVAVMLDCCHSGGLDRALNGLTRGRFMPHRVAEHLALAYARNRRMTVEPRSPLAKLAEVRAGVILFTACREQEVAADGEDFGAFTQSALGARACFWLRPTWAKWFRHIEKYCRSINPAQHPQARRLGANVWERKAF